MATVRTNLVPNPRYLGPDAAGGGGSAAWEQVDTPSGAPDGGGRTRFTATTDAAADVNVGRDDDGLAAVTPGLTYTGSTYVRTSRDGLPFIQAFLGWVDASGAAMTSILGARTTGIKAGTDYRIDATGVAPDGAAGVYVIARFGYTDDGPNLRAGDYVYVAQRLVEAGERLNAYFDGDYPDTKYATYAWTGEANASPSTETYTGPPSITAELLTSSTVPSPVRLVLSNIPAGDSYVVTGIGSGGRTWNVAGGTGVSQGVQIILDDLRAPVNQLIRYRLVVSGTEAGTYDSNALTVPWAPKDGDSKAVIQSLDGKTVVTLASWIDNQLPVQPVINTTGFPIRGRARPVMVMATAGAGTMTVIWRLHRLESDKLEKIIADGGGIALRTDGTARDLPISDIAVITGASSALWEADNGISTDRVWELELTWIDDPEPSSVPVIYTVDDVDGILAGKTVDEVDALFAGQTIDDVDAQDWSEVS